MPSRTQSNRKQHKMWQPFAVEHMGTQNGRDRKRNDEIQ